MDLEKVCQKIALLDLKKNLIFVECNNKYDGLIMHLIMHMLKKTKSIYEENQFFNYLMTALYLVAIVLVTLYVHTHSYVCLLFAIGLVGVAIGNVWKFYQNETKLKIYKEIIEVCEFHTKITRP